MSVKWNVRLPEELAEKIDAKAKAQGCTRTDVIVKTLSLGMDWSEFKASSTPAPTHDLAELPMQHGGDVVTVTACGADIAESKTRDAIAKVAKSAASHLKPASQVDPPQPKVDCPLCSKPLVTWGSLKRCVNCKRNYAAAELR